MKDPVVALGTHILMSVGSHPVRFIIKYLAKIWW
jgi:hypothetical protein